jgi:hypothetical protein
MLILKLTLALSLAIAFPSLADAGEGKFTVNQCLLIMKALRALDRAGAPLDPPPGPQPSDAKQYRLGALRMTIATNLAALSVVGDSFDRARRQLIREHGGEATPQFMDAFQKILDRPCEATLGHIKLSELKLGDGAEENAIPPTVLAALAPIIDVGK